MNEPKRRGRPPKATPELIALPVACPECGQAEGHYDDCPVGMGVQPEARPPFTIEDKARGEVIFFVTEEARDACLRAQAYANRVWAGQSPDVKRAERIERVKRALAGQNLPFEGVVLP